MTVLRRTALLVVTALLATLAVLIGPSATAGATPGTNDYPYRNSTADQVDRWNFYTRECTSFVAWRLNNDNGVAFNNAFKGVHWGSAYNWDNAAIAAGVPVDSTPTHGAVAQFNAGVDGVSSGHVAYVLDWNATQIKVEDYNWNSFAYDIHWLGRSGVNFIHFGHHK